MSSMLGADADALDRLARRMHTASQGLGLLGRTLDVTLRAAPWFGRSAEMFRERWGAEHARSLVEASQFLLENSQVLRRDAQQQRDASAADSVMRTPTTGVIKRHQASSGYDPLTDAFAAAGIDPSSWDPTAGMDGNRSNIEAVYEYYAQLYRDHPELLWAGMAALIGPSFYAGFADLDQFADLAALARVIVSNGPLLAALSPPLQASLRSLAQLSAKEIEQEFRWYEQRFLSMQREIFEDQARQHQAYVNDGIDGIRRLHRSGHLDDATLRAWQQIDEGKRTGNQALIAQGNAGLLLREQKDIIRDDYDAMYQRRTGPALTYAATITGRPSIPGARSYPEVFPLVIDSQSPEIYIGTPRRIFGQDLPHLGVDSSVRAEVTTPLADGNISNFRDRWALIRKDTLPAYLDMSRQERLEVLDTPISERMQDHRFTSQIDDLMKQLTRWDVDVDVDVGVRASR